MKLLIERSVITLWTAVCFLATCRFPQHCFKALQGEDGRNFMCCLWDVRCPSNFQQETPSTPTQINSNFLCIKGIIINLCYNGICQSKVILLKDKCPSCNPQTPLTFLRKLQFQRISVCLVLYSKLKQELKTLSDQD